MSTSAVPAVIDYLVAQARASTALGASTTAPVTIYDGPTIDGAWPNLSLHIGSELAYVLTPDVTPAPEAAFSNQTWVGAGNRKRNENLTIHCVIDAHVGESITKMARDAAHSVLSAFEDMTRVDANTGGTVLFNDPGVTNTHWYAGQIKDGARALITFDFNCDARIGV